MLETLDHTIRIGSTPTFLYFDLYLYSAYAAHYVYICSIFVSSVFSPLTATPPTLVAKRPLPRQRFFRRWSEMCRNRQVCRRKGQRRFFPLSLPLSARFRHISDDLRKNFCGGESERLWSKLVTWFPKLGSKIIINERGARQYRFVYRRFYFAIVSWKKVTRRIAFN